MTDHKDLIGNIYVIDDGQYPIYNRSKNTVKLIKIIDVHFDPKYLANVMEFITNYQGDKKYIDRVILLSYYRLATPEEIMLYWPDNL